MTRSGGTENLTNTAIRLFGLLELSWSDLTEKTWNQTLTHLRLPGLKVDDGQHTTLALGRKGSYLTFRAFPCDMI